MNSEDHQYDMKITSKALQHILKKLPNKDDYGLVIMNRGITGGGYDIVVFKRTLLQSSRYYPVLFPAEYHNYGFNIYVDPLLVKEHYLPDVFVIDLGTDANGMEILEIKNPEFETISEK